MHSEEQNYYKGIRQVIMFNSDESLFCEHCDYEAEENMQNLANHYIETHGYRILHVGSQHRGTDNGILQRTVIVMGR